MSEKNVPNRRYIEEFRKEAARLANSVGHNEVARRLGVSVATIGNWARLQLKQGALTPVDVAAPAARTKPAVSELEAEIAGFARSERQAGNRNTLKSDGVLREGVAVKYAWIDANRDRYGVSRLRRVLCVQSARLVDTRVLKPCARSCFSLLEN